VRHLAIQLLRYLNFSSIIAYASAHQFDHLRSLGATHFVDRKAVSFVDLATTLKSITSDPIEVVYDTISSAESQQAGYDSLVKGGRMVVVLPDQIKNKIAGDDKKVLTVLGNTHPEANRGFGKIIAENLPKLLEEGTIVVCFDYLSLSSRSSIC
jgi:NADPH:quinone reductase-like Zn-dependent oxidoreductase